MNQQTMPPQTEQPTPAEIDALKLQRFRQNIKENQNLSLGFLAGLGAAAVGAIMWALVTDLTHFQIGWMAVGVGFLVGYAIRRFGQGIDPVFGVMGAVLALGGCLVGNLLSACMMLAHQESLSVLDVLVNLNLPVSMELVTATFHPMDVLFYGLAIYQGYKFSFRQVTPQELSGLVKTS